MRFEGSRGSRSGRDSVPVWAALGSAGLGLIGAFAMVRSPGSDVLGNAGRPEGWFGLLFIAATIFFVAVYRSFGRPRALKLAAVAAIVALGFALLAAVTLPPDCGELGDQGLPLACLDVYGKDPDAAMGPSTWGIWVLAIGSLIAAGTAIAALAGAAQSGSAEGPASSPRSRTRSAERRRPLP